ncbi:universal stress protein [Iamia sp. SCSIO 61187]|uniref:universal stress protein n=1 Tax=Iamia sp. SCSIO 61187 TaxID=2722752 RepID=UPI001C62B618|nr:universal stress protein [Iamia sp. SCSIO 61187]QYG93517.1 universal stress protein [Iamia sp. SCSIO 61187]
MERIVVGVDETPAAAAAARFAVEEGRARGWPVTAVLCWAYPGRHGEGPGEPSPDGGDRPRSPALDRLLRDALGSRVDEVARTVDEVDFAVSGLLHHVDAGDLLVLGPSRAGLTHGLVSGSVTQRCLRRTPCPVAVVHDGAVPPPQRVVVGVDGSAPSEGALRWALAEGRARGLPVHLVHAWEVPILAAPVLLDPRDPVHRDAARAELDRIVGALPPSAGDVHVEPVLVEGPPADVLLERSEQGDLVVVGTRGIGGVAALLLGSTALRLSQLAPGPVVLVPDP